MSVGHASPALIRIEAGDIDHAGALVQALLGAFRAEDVSLDSDRFEVEVRPLEDANGAVIRALEVVEAWLAADGLGSALVYVHGHSYRVEARPGAPAGHVAPTRP
jgi:hypothetical protein